MPTSNLNLIHKNFRFLKWESDQLDAGTIDVETEQSDTGEGE